MNEPPAPPTPVRQSSPRRVRSTVQRHDRPVTSGAVVDQSRFVTERPVAQRADEVLGTGEQRLVRIVATYGAIAVVWLGLLALVTSTVLGATSWSPVAVTVVVGLVFVIGSSGIMLVALQRWARQLTNAAAAEREAMESLREVARIRSAFLGGISHELRTPMTSILGFAQTLQRHHRELEPQNIEEFAGRLVANTTRLERLVLDMLDLHQHETDADLRIEPVHVEQLLRAALAATGPRSQQITAWSTADWVLTDRGKLERIVAELVGNVVRHTPAGTSAWLQASVDPEIGELLITMEDDGPGLEDDILEQATAPFVQGPRAQASPSPGLGIGLSLARRHAELLGGALTLARPEGGGTRVIVALPYVAPDRPE